MGFLIVTIVAFLVYYIATKDKRAERKEQKKRELEQKKREMMSDQFISKTLFILCSHVTDLTGGHVRALRADGVYWLVFKRGDIFIETRWTEKVGDSYERKKNSKCILNRIELGKNPLSDEENLIYTQVAFDKLNQISWLAPKRNGNEIRMEKAKDAIIPEASSVN